MKPNYRFTPKPGIARSGRIVNTNVKPIIVAGQPNVVKTNITPKTPKSQQVKRAVVKKINKPVVQRASPPKRKKRSGVRASPLRRRKELEIGRYKKLVEDLKGIGKGRTLIMVACGPSIMEVDLPKLQEHPLIDLMSINKPDPRVHPTRWWVFCDQSQYMRNKETFENYTGTLINAWSVRARHNNQILIRNKSGKGFSKNLLQGYYIGRSTTFANLQTAYWMGYDKIYVFGCDMCKPPNTDDLHFYGRNQDVDPAIRVKRFAKEAEFYLAGAKQLDGAERKKIIFCSAYNTWPFVKEFGSMDHHEAVNHILAEADEKMDKNK
jgi:hypothetical protein